MLNLLFLGDSDRGHLGPRWQDGPLSGSLYGREAWVVAPVAQMAQGCPGAGLESLGCSRVAKHVHEGPSCLLMSAGTLKWGLL